jgi:hypothetical protein
VVVWGFIASLAILVVSAFAIIPGAAFVRCPACANPILTTSGRRAHEKARRWGIFPGTPPAAPAWPFDAYVLASTLQRSAKP